MHTKTALLSNVHVLISPNRCLGVLHDIDRQLGGISYSRRGETIITVHKRSIDGASMRMFDEPLHNFDDVQLLKRTYFDDKPNVVGYVVQIEFFDCLSF